VIFKGSKFLIFKIFNVMKMNQNFAKKAMLVASLTAGVVGFNSMFNEAQATGRSGSDNGRPLMSNGSTYCCQNNGDDCAAACC
jgi:hypothetical protein